MGTTTIEGASAVTFAADATTGVEALVRDHGRRLMRLAYLLTGDQHEAEDLWQDTIADAHRAWPRVAASESPLAYVRAMMANRHTSRRRRRWTGERATDPVVLHDRAPATPDHADRLASDDAVWRTLATLPPRTRTVLVLRFVEDQSDDQIATALGISRSSVAATASRGLATLRDRGDLR